MNSALVGKGLNQRYLIRMLLWNKGKNMYCTNASTNVDFYFFHNVFKIQLAVIHMNKKTLSQYFNLCFTIHSAIEGKKV